MVHKLKGYVVSVVFALLVLLTAASDGSSTAAVAGRSIDAASDSVYFQQTGQSINGKFLQYWREQGGLALFGYPITPAFIENGYTVQYFERNRFEYHPENAGTPYEVLLGLLGRERLLSEGRRVSAPEQPGQSANGSIFFSETGYRVGGAFLDFWREHGGLAIFGYPITPLIHDDAANLTVQYFERARFELHPEFKDTPHYVLLTLLGWDRANKLDPALHDRWAEQPPAAHLVVATGPGEHTQVEPLAPVTITSQLGGSVRLLGGDNRSYATYRVEAGTPLTIYPAGEPGPQSVMLYNNQGQVADAVWSAFTMGAPQQGIRTGDPSWDTLYPQVKGFLEKDAVVYYSPLDDKPVRGYRSPDTLFIWLRDHVYQSKGFKYFEPDMKSTLDYFRSTQHADGSFDDYFLHFPGLEIYKDQVEIEADREFLFVDGVWTAWQASGDDTWLRENIPAMERGLEHTLTDPHRWSTELGLIKRAFTIDTWDFEQGSDVEGTRRKFDSKTRWGIMHGDNTGAYEAARTLARIERYFGRMGQAQLWDTRADTLARNLDRISWNGHFYTHQVHITPVEPTGVDEATQLSLSNAYALNRGTLSQQQAAEVLRTYQARREANGPRIFAEWYSIDPPFPTGFSPPGEYVNGGVMPLVGGELARGALDHGFEAYGLDILRRYRQLVERTGGSYLWYYPDGRPGIKPEGGTLPTDGWGSAAMLSALTEGLAGVVDRGKLYEQVTLSPRWAATDRETARVALGYGASNAYFAYVWQRHPDNSLSLAWGGKQTREVKLHMLLPAELSTPHALLLNGREVAFTVTTVEDSRYLDVTLPGNGSVVIK